MGVSVPKKFAYVVGCLPLVMGAPEPGAVCEATDAPDDGSGFLLGASVLSVEACSKCWGFCAGRPASSSSRSLPAGGAWSTGASSGASPVQPMPPY